jgi:hypothetical protein
VNNCIFSNYLPGEGADTVAGVNLMQVFGVIDGAVVEATNSYVEFPCLVWRSSRFCIVLTSIGAWLHGHLYTTSRPRPQDIDAKIDQA